jgi:hypothetical protein
MDVTFRRTGERRYAVIVAVPGKPLQALDPAPGYDHDIPHDLVHYVVEAELSLKSGVFGRAARGGGTFIQAEADPQSPRERARQRRKQARRERSLDETDETQEMAVSERLAGLCDLAWRRRRGQRPDPARWHVAAPLSTEDAPRVARVVARLDELARAWGSLPVGGELRFEWPSVVPVSPSGRIALATG